MANPGSKGLFDIAATHSANIETQQDIRRSLPDLLELLLTSSVHADARSQVQQNLGDLCLSSEGTINFLACQAPVSISTKTITSTLVSILSQTDHLFFQYSGQGNTQGSPTEWHKKSRAIRKVLIDTATHSQLLWLQGQLQVPLSEVKIDALIAHLDFFVTKLDVDNTDKSFSVWVGFYNENVIPFIDKCREWLGSCQSVVEHGADGYSQLNKLTDVVYDMFPNGLTPAADTIDFSVLEVLALDLGGFSKPSILSFILLSMELNAKFQNENEVRVQASVFSNYGDDEMYLSHFPCFNDPQSVVCIARHLYSEENKQAYSNILDYFKRKFIDKPPRNNDILVNLLRYYQPDSSGDFVDSLGDLPSAEQRGSLVARISDRGSIDNINAFRESVSLSMVEPLTSSFSSRQSRRSCGFNEPDASQQRCRHMTQLIPSYIAQFKTRCETFVEGVFWSQAKYVNQLLVSADHFEPMCKEVKAIRRQKDLLEQQRRLLGSDSGAQIDAINSLFTLVESNYEEIARLYDRFNDSSNFVLQKFDIALPVNEDQLCNEITQLTCKYKTLPRDASGFAPITEHAISGAKEAVLQQVNRRERRIGAISNNIRKLEIITKARTFCEKITTVPDRRVYSRSTEFFSRKKKRPMLQLFVDALGQKITANGASLEDLRLVESFLYSLTSYTSRNSADIKAEMFTLFGDAANDFIDLFSRRSRLSAPSIFCGVRLEKRSDTLKNIIAAWLESSGIVPRSPRA